jgi:hypothetical protein
MCTENSETTRVCFLQLGCLLFPTQPQRNEKPLYFGVGREKVSLLPESQKRKDLMFLNSLHLDSLSHRDLIQMYSVKLLTSAAQLLNCVDRNPWGHLNRAKFMEKDRR